MGSEKYDSSPGEAWAADGTVMCMDPAWAVTQPQDKAGPFATFSPEDVCHGDRGWTSRGTTLEIRDICPFYLI